MTFFIFLLIVLIFLNINSKYDFINLKSFTQDNIIVKDGKVDFEILLKTKYSLNDVINLLQLQGIKKLEDISLARIKNNRLIIKRYQNPVSLIFNGKVDYQMLNDIEKTPKWLFNILESKKLNVGNIYYSFYIDDRIYIIQKDL
ncbi:MAG: YetF domain-containing protein [Bacilli bacterium]